MVELYVPSLASDRTEYTVLDGCERLGIYSLSQAMGLTKLHTYSGSSDDWSMIEIGKDNEYLTDASVEIHCAEQKQRAQAGTVFETKVGI